MLSVAEARQIILADIQRGRSETVALMSSAGKTLRQPIVGPRDVPPFHKALMDGFALRAEDFQGEDSSFRVLGTLPAGSTFAKTLAAGDCLQIMTGAPLPEGADAIVPVERSQLSDDRSIVRFSVESVSAGENVLPQASLSAKGDELLAEGRVIRPQEIALFAEHSYHEVDVSTPPSVAILATGDELVPAGTIPGPDQIVNSNAPMLAAQAVQAGAQPRLLGIARDEVDHLTELIRQGLESDFLILSGGVSAGEWDLVPQVLSDLGVVQQFHKVRMKPGKPLWYGIRKNIAEKTTYVFGTPGNPVSGMVCFSLFVRPAIRKFLGRNAVETPPVPLPLLKPHVARGSRPIYHPARIVVRDCGIGVETVSWRGSSDVRATTEADCLIGFPAGDREFLAGEPVEVFLLNETLFPAI